MKKQLLLTTIASIALVTATFAANTENDWIGSATGNTLTGTNWSLGHAPTVSEDATFNSSSTSGIKSLGSGATTGNLTVGSLNVTATANTYSIRNNTSTATDTILTLGGAGSTGNSVAPNSADLLYAASGSTLQLLGVNGSSGTGVLRVALGQSGNFDAVGDIVVSSVISGGFAITKTGAGTLTLSGANTYSGGLTLSAGTLRFNNAAAAGSGTFAISGGTLTNTSAAAITVSNAVSLDGDFTAAVGSGTNGLTFSGPVTLTGNRAINVSGATNNFEISGSIGGAFSLTKNGPGVGTLILSGNNTYSGGTFISSRTLVVTSTGNLGTGNVSLTAGNVTLTLQGASNIASSATLSYVNTDTINLSYSGNMTIAGLVVDGVNQGPGVYSASGNNPDGAFAGVGTLTVVPEPTTLGMVALGGSLLVGAMRFRRKLR